MKSDERRELKQNDLVTLWQKHGNKVLLVLTACFLALAAVRYQRNQKAQRQAQTQLAVNSAWSGVRQLQRLLGPGVPPGLEKQRADLVSDINQSAQAVLDDPAVTPAQAAAALLARGQTYWELAHAPAADAAATKPASQPTSQPAAQTPAQQLDLSAAAYGQVVRDYSGEGVAATIARYSLAAIDEEKGDTDAARAQYKALIETPNFTTPPQTAGTGTADAKSTAEARLAMLDKVSKPALLLPATQPVLTPAASEDTSLVPGLTGPMLPRFGGRATPAATQPTTAPAAVAPTTRP